MNNPIEWINISCIVLYKYCIAVIRYKLSIMASNWFIKIPMTTTVTEPGAFVQPESILWPEQVETSQPPSKKVTIHPINM